MLIQDRSIEADLFLGGIGIELTTYGINPVQDMKCFSLTGSLEGHMLPEMGNPLLCRRFISAADI